MNTKNRLLACVLIALLQSILLQGASQEEGWVYLQRMQSGQASQDDIDRAIEEMRQGRAAEALARFPTAILAEYVDVQRSVNANIARVMRRRISTRDDFHLSMVVRYTGMITLDGLDYAVTFPEYFTQRQDIFYVIQTPGGETFRLNIVPDPSVYWADLNLGTSDSPSITAIGNSPQRTWDQESLPDFEQEGVYRIRLEGRFQDRNGIEPPLEFATNTVSFEISSRFLSREEERQQAEERRRQADEEFNRQFPLGPVHVLGWVNRPGRIGLQAEMRLSDAIALAGGLSRAADFRWIRLVREMGDDTEEEIIDFNAVLEGEREDPLLRRNDRIFVPQRYH